MPWHLGNLHCHSTRSDGDSHPASVARFYRDHGFDFVAITDHNVCTGQAEVGEALDGFTVLGACEYSAASGGRPLHINGIGVSRAVVPEAAARDVLATLQHGIEAFRAQHAFTIMNHPNWHWGWGLEELLAVSGVDAFELWNGARDSNNLGDHEHPGTEALWDAALTSGKRIWAVASDDCHHFGHRRRFSSDPPFSGWVAVQAPSASEADVLAALRAGNFYASTGLRLADLHLAPDRIEIRTACDISVAQRIVVIASGGREVATYVGNHARHEPRGDEGYLRVRVDTGEGDHVWSQPLFLD